MDMNVLTPALASQIRTFHLPKYRELPDIGLYLEQVTEYINRQLAPLGLPEVSGSMIRNYVKKGLIANPEKKRYYADQIAHLLAVCLLKWVMSLENIHALFRFYRQTYSTQTAYDYLGDELENVLYVQFEIKDTLDDVGTSSSAARQMLCSAIIALSNIIYLNGCFRELPPSKETP